METSPRKVETNEEREARIVLQHKAEQALKKAITQREPTDSLIKRGGFQPVLEERV